MKKLIKKRNKSINVWDLLMKINSSNRNSFAYSYYREVSVRGRFNKVNRYGNIINFKVSDKLYNRHMHLMRLNTYTNELNKNGYYNLDGTWHSFDSNTTSENDYIDYSDFFANERYITEICINNILINLEKYYNLKKTDNGFVYIKHAQLLK